MKFTEYLSTHLTPEWSSQYIRYADLKDIIEKDKPKSNENADPLTIRLSSSTDFDFFKQCEEELLKINAFYAEKLSEAQIKIEDLKLQLTKNLQIHERIESEKNIVINKNFISIKYENKKDKQLKDLKRKHKKNMSDLKLAFSEYYLFLILLQNYQALNFTGFRKILKKHDKIYKTDSGAEWRKANVECAPFYTNKLVDSLIIETENLFINNLENGNRQKAMKRLRVPQYETKRDQWTIFNLGICLGMILILIPLLSLLFYFLRGPNEELKFEWKFAIKFYRISLFIIMHIIFIGLNIYGWGESGVNHVLIFEINPRRYLSHYHYLKIGSFLFVCWLINGIIFVVSAYFEIEHNVWPASFVFILVLFLLNPFPILNRNSRYWLIRVFGRVLTAPFHPVGFADFWFADQLVSFEFLFPDIQYLFCWSFTQAKWAPFYTEDSTICSPKNMRDLSHAYNIFAIILGCLPAWFRFAQCLRRYRDTKKKFPHLANAFKYGTTFIDTFFFIIRNHFSQYYVRDFNNPYFYLWTFVRCISTFYKFIWDVKMDWGFFEKNAGENHFLRKICIYPSKYYYYLAIVQNFFLRFLWLVRLHDINATERTESIKEVVYSVIGLAEIYRRFIWNFFRLENEHLNNCGQFRAVRDIPLARFAYSDFVSLKQLDMQKKNDYDKQINDEKSLELQILN